MAHFAQIDEAGNVLRVIVVSNDSITDEAGTESEELGSRLCAAFGPGRWVQTSYSGAFRKNFAGIGYSYDASLDAFIPPRPYDSWTLDESTCRWKPPTPHPSGQGFHRWDEHSSRWIPVRPYA